jgi:hypothetical protein
VILTWTNPENYPDFAGISIVRKTGGYQTTHRPELEIGITKAETFTDTAVLPGTTYYYSIFVFNDQENYSDPVYVSFKVPGTASSTPSTPATDPTARPLPDQAAYPSGILYKNPGSATIYLKEGEIGRPITEYNIYRNNFSTQRKVITLPKDVVIPSGDEPLSLRSGSLVRSRMDQTVYLISGKTKRPFASREELIGQGYRLNQVSIINDATVLEKYDTVSGELIRPTGTWFKYSSSPTVYFLNSHREKRAFTSYQMLNLWIPSASLIITVPDSETYPDGPLVTLPDGILVKGSSATVYLTADGKLRPFASQSAFQWLGFRLFDIVKIQDSDLALQEVGEIIE